jgi:XTP/dITP diphosphohydrolase
MTRLVAATANPAKLAEMEAILGDAELGLVIELAPRPPEVPDVVEDAPDLVGNARLKAQAIASASGEAAVADDTGLEVTALGGGPGVRSARFAGEHATDAENVDRLLADLADAVDRSARFRTVALVVDGDYELACDGVCSGTIATERRGEGGFGYDPVFIPDEGDGRTFAEMSPDEKHAISHRGRAFRALARRLAERDD